MHLKRCIPKAKEKSKTLDKKKGKPKLNSFFLRSIYIIYIPG